jgi:hypothetical protein
MMLYVGSYYIVFVGDLWGEMGGGYLIGKLAD